MGLSLSEELYDPRLVKGPYRPRQMASWGPGGSAPILYDDCTVGSGHSVRIAGSGSGKTESLKLSLRTTWSGPTVVLDPKQTLGSRVRERSAPIRPPNSHPESRLRFGLWI